MITEHIEKRLYQYLTHKILDTPHCLQKLLRFNRGNKRGLDRLMTIKKDVKTPWQIVLPNPATC